MNKIIPILFVVAAVVGGYFLYQSYNKNKAPAETNNQQATTTNEQATNTNNFEIQGMKVEILKEGTGDGAKSGDTVTVNYVGTFEDGKKFGSSIDGGVPFSFTLGAGTIIKGWDLGVVGMKVGEKRKLTIPSNLAYGEAGAGGGLIPPNTTLVFEIDLLSIK
ncbi:MAG: FKBP-type peptidyl-prolyl cis-trans isomerase [Candidatus Paceibacterota bacterium]